MGETLLTFLDYVNRYKKTCDREKLVGITNFGPHSLFSWGHFEIQKKTEVRDQN